MARFGLILGRCGVDLGSIWRPNGRSNEKGPTGVSYRKNQYKTHLDASANDPEIDPKSLWEASWLARPFRTVLGVLRGLPGSLSGHLRDAPGRPMTARGAPGAPQKPPPERFGASEGHLGSPRGRPGGLRSDLGSIWGRFGVDLGSIWVDLGSIWVACALDGVARWLPIRRGFFFRPSSRLRRPCNDLSAASAPQ